MAPKEILAMNSYRAVLEVLRISEPKSVSSELTLVSVIWLQAASSRELWHSHLDDLGASKEDSEHPKIAFIRTIQQHKTIITLSNDRFTSFNIETGTWKSTTLAPTQIEGLYYSYTVLLDGSIFYCGGFYFNNSRSDQSTLRTVHVISQSGVISDLTPMMKGRYAHGIVRIGGKIYVFGGLQSRGALGGDPVLRNEVFSDSHWTSLPDLHSGKYWFTPCVYRNLIYLCGGMTPSLEIFNPETGKIDALSLCTLPEMGENVVVGYKDYLVIVTSTKVSKWHLEKKTLDVKEKQKSAVWAGAGTVLYGDLLYIAGRKSGGEGKVIEMETGKMREYSVISA